MGGILENLRFQKPPKALPDKMFGVFVQTLINLK